MKRNTLITTLYLGIFVSLVLLVFSALHTNSLARTQMQGQSNNLQTGFYPWSTQPDTLPQRLSNIGLPSLSQEGTTLHTHQHLDIFINGDPVIIPEGIGIDNTDGIISPIHTHDTTGIIHIESPLVQTFNLGQFFDIWGVRFNDNCLGGYCNNSQDQIYLYKNGVEIINNFRTLPLEAHDEIAIYYGSKPNISNVPSSYTFPMGL